MIVNAPVLVGPPAWRHRWRLLALFLGMLILLYSFGDLVEDIWTEGGMAWDVPIMEWVHRYDTPARDRLMYVITQLGFPAGVLPLDVLIFGLLWLRHKTPEARFFGWAVGGAAVLNSAAKLLFRRTRPHRWFDGVTERSPSFPSGHAMASLALVTTLIILAWPTRWRWPALVGGPPFVGLVGLSRVYLGVHYPSDISAAWAATLVWVAGVAVVTHEPAGDEQTTR